MKDLAVPLAEPGWWLCMRGASHFSRIAPGGRVWAWWSEAYVTPIDLRLGGYEEHTLPIDVSTYLFVNAQTWFRARAVARVKLGTDHVLCVLNTKPTVYPRTPKGLFDAWSQLEQQAEVVQHYVGNAEERAPWQRGRRRVGA